MSLLKGDDTLPKRIDSIGIISWPLERKAEGLGLSIKDGWNLGLGFGLAMTIAIPLILVLISCVIGIGLSIIGTSIGALIGG